MLNCVQGLEDGLRRYPEAVVVEPLKVANPDHDLGQLVGVVIDLDAVELLGAHLWEEGRHPVAGGKGDHLLLQVEQVLEGDVEEVATAAGGVKNPLAGNRSGKPGEEPYE